MPKIINVLIVDDSAFMRKSLTLMLESDPQIKVVATATNGQDGIEKIRKLRPDLVTMDIEMPVLDGLSALKIIMKEMPLPVLMVSSLTTEGAQATIEALNIGAVDFIPKQLSYVSLDIAKIKDDLIQKVKSIAESRSLQFRLMRIRQSAQRMGQAAPKPAPAVNKSAVSALKARRDFRAVTIAVSTGGPFALLQIIPQLPEDFPLGIVIVQHMPPNFTRSLADRLNGLSKVRVKEGEDGDRIEPGHVLIAPGGKHMTVHKAGSGYEVRTGLQPTNTLYRPCADVMIKSAVEAFDAPLMGVILTGMGRDGADALKLVKAKKGHVIAQDEESCVVYGMPRAAVEDGTADTVVPLDDVPNAMVALVGGKMPVPTQA